MCRKIRCDTLGWKFLKSKGAFSSGNFWLLATVALSFLFGKNYSIIDYLGLKDSSHDFLANCVISFFYVYI